MKPRWVLNQAMTRQHLYDPEQIPADGIFYSGYWRWSVCNLATVDPNHIQYPLEHSRIPQCKACAKREVKDDTDE